MNRTERVKVIKESATLLAKRDWAEIDLILAQFGLETREDWASTPPRLVTAAAVRVSRWVSTPTGAVDVLCQHGHAVVLLGWGGRGRRRPGRSHRAAQL
jgi:hypothetical protein